MAESSEVVRVGLGFDVHPIVRNRHMRFLGVLVSSEIGLEGFSDGDALSHAVADALLGAAGLGDIGTHFPAGNPQFKNISGEDLLTKTVKILESANWKPLQVDSVVWLEYPVLAPHLAQIRQRLAELLGLPESAVSVKLKRGEGLGFVGSGQGIAVWAIALVSLLRARRQPTGEQVARRKDPTTAPARQTGRSTSGEAESAERIPADILSEPLRSRQKQQSASTSQKPPLNRAIIYIDGGAEPNPGLAAAGIVFHFPDGTIRKAGKFLGERLTNNEAEYAALIWSMEEADRLRLRDVEIRSDSDLLVSQVTGRYQVRQPHLKALHRRVMELQKKFRHFRIVKIPRSENQLADEEARKALAGR